MQRKVTPRSVIKQQSLFILFGHLVELLAKMIPQDTRFKAEQKTDLSLGVTVVGRVKLERNFKSLARIRRKLLVLHSSNPSTGKRGMWDSCVRLFHPWPQRQAEMFFTGRSASCCLHGLPQHCDAFPVLKWAHHLLAALEWGEITLKGSDHLLFVLCTCLYKLWGAEESVLYSVLISSSIKQWSRPCRLLTSSRLETLYNKMILLW